MCERVANDGSGFRPSLWMRAHLYREKRGGVVRGVERVGMGAGKLCGLEPIPKAASVIESIGTLPV